MSIIITNISEGEGIPDRYVVRVNQDLICYFDHTRTADGLAQCLRDAADAVDSERSKGCFYRWAKHGSPFLNELSESPRVSGETKSKK